MSSGVQSRLIGKEGLLNVTNGVETDRIDDNRLTMYDQRPLNDYLQNYFNKNACLTSLNPKKNPFRLASLFNFVTKQNHL